MPKTGLDASQWRSRLHSYATGKFYFSRGQRPQRGSKWAKEVASIEGCPKHRARSGRDVFGRAILCHCGYHKEMVWMYKCVPYKRLGHAYVHISL